MAEFEDQLNSLLSNPDAMAQIMQLAQSLGGSSPSPAAPPPQEPPPASFSPGPPSGGPSTGGGDLLSSLTGGLDPGLLIKLLPLIQELGSQQNSHARTLLYALRPYLKEERQEKIERALQLAKLFHLGKKFLAGWEG